jgi:hypothetical protein
MYTTFSQKTQTFGKTTFRKVDRFGESEATNFS